MREQRKRPSRRKPAAAPNAPKPPAADGEKDRKQEALDLVRAWGFMPKTELVWKKLTTSGKRHIGMGRYLRAEHETCIVATRGKVRPAVRTLRRTASLVDRPLRTSSR